MSLTGCATIVGKDTQLVSIKSEPPGAAVQISDKNKDVVFTGTTPTTVVLKKSTGKYFGAQDYNVNISLPGYETQNVYLSEGVNGWYFGNILLGGVVGMLLVDPWNGGMYTMKNSDINLTLYKPGEKPITQPKISKTNTKMSKLQKELGCSDEEMKDGSCQ
jgi:hypothetical protein